jgi:phage N-6-adenine-methyltransferase
MLTQGEKTGYEGEWMTPPGLIEWIEKLLGKIDVDIAASPENHICKNYLTDAFNNDWICKNGFINPPFDNIEPFLIKASKEVLKGNAKKITILCPLNIVGNQWWRKIQDDYPYSYRIELNPRVQYVPHPKNKKGFDKKGKPKMACNGPSQLIFYNRTQLENEIVWEKWK